MLRRKQTVGMTFLSDRHIFPPPLMQRVWKSRSAYQKLWYILYSHGDGTWKFHLFIFFLMGDQRHIRSWWKMNGGRNLQMERNPSHDWVEGELRKTVSGEREQLRACHEPEKPTRLCPRAWEDLPEVQMLLWGKQKPNACHPEMALAVHVID